jgi:two-component system, cell cycle sensor histidine kinase and response regulator CckA
VSLILAPGVVRSQRMAALDLDRDLARGLVEAVPDALVLTDLDGRVLFANARAEALFGYARAEVIDRPAESLLTDGPTPEVVVDRKELIASVLSRPDALGSSAQLWGRRRDGTEFPLQVAFSTMRTARGSFLLWAIRDVAECFDRAQALRRSESSFRELFARAPDGIFIAGLEGLFIDANIAACEMVGYSRREIIGMSVVDFVAAEDVPHLAEAREKMQTEGCVDLHDSNMRRKDGTFVRVEVSAKVLADGRWLGFIRDLARRRCVLPLPRVDTSVRAAETQKAQGG